MMRKPMLGGDKGRNSEGMSAWMDAHERLSAYPVSDVLARVDAGGGLFDRVVAHRYRAESDDPQPMGDVHPERPNRNRVPDGGSPLGHSRGLRGGSHRTPDRLA